MDPDTLRTDIERESRRYEEWKDKLLKAPEPRASPVSEPSGTMARYLYRLRGMVLRWTSKISRFALVPPASPPVGASAARDGGVGVEAAPRVMRVNQMDAETLDEDLYRLLWSRMERLGRHLGREVLDQWSPELRAVLRTIIFWNTTWKNRPTPGMELQNIRLIGTGRWVRGAGSAAYRMLTLQQRKGLGLLLILVPWLVERVKGFMSDWQWYAFGRRSLRGIAYTTVDRMEQLWEAVSVVHFLLFLSGGSYRSMVERLLRIRVAYVNPRAHRALSFEFMNQYLVWRTVSRVLLFAIPLVDFGAAWRMMQTAVGMQSDTDRRAGSGDEACGICGSNPITIAVSAVPCRHVFCYTCLRTLRMETRNPTCPIPGCARKIEGEERLRYHSPQAGERKDDIKTSASE